MTGPLADSAVADAGWLSGVAPPWWTSGRTPDSMDLSGWMPPVIDQGQIPLCTAAVTAAIAGYYARRAERLEFTPSVLFNYRLSRTLAGSADRRGSRLEHSFRAWAEFGLCEEALWPYDEHGRTRVDRDPPEHCHTTARRTRPLARSLSAPDGPGLLGLARRAIAMGIPVSVEVRLCPSISMSLVNGGVIPVQLATELSVGPHVVLLTGYDDRAETAPYDRGAGPGAFRVRNSWGTGWGDQGYGLLPYAFLEQRLTGEHWIVVEEDWRKR
ncbi:C1 family peptidase [Streptomyces sparsogenes]|uniref:Putative C1A family peptidase n=1 Tax=Streptomyces sparsogenes DSM 40356 TaxID=1331668 RepID=A0A1R1S5M2_9ACTN|nr:C1 family peptidase [Streptomyces sparsogenes]OMI33590.1 putative C1A family peptidase [Streptomyces sparsogenes DSM 40356]